MKQIVYKCDYCNTVFGEKEHLNLKSFNLFKSNRIYNSDPWESVPIFNSKIEYHFCDTDCLIGWIRCGFTHGDMGV